MTFRQAVALGALHGPAELLPISSSGHTTAIPWLLGTDYAELDPELRKALEVALHAGAVLGLLLTPDQELRADLREMSRRHLLVVVAGSVPPGVAGLALERRIETTLGTPPTLAAGLLAGSLAMALADRAPAVRRAEDAAIRDGLWLGLAGASALVPGVSRAGATLAAARWRCFGRDGAARLSRELAWPVITGATLLKAWRLRKSGSYEQVPALLAGLASSLLSTILTGRLTHRRPGGPLLPYALYRTALGAAILVRLKLGRAAQDQGHI